MSLDEIDGVVLPGGVANTDIRNAGGTWVDQEVCRDDNLVSSRNPDDLPAFCDAMVALFAEEPVT